MAMNKKVVDALLALGNINNVGERRVALLKVSEKHGRASIKPGYAGVRRLLNPQIKALESAHAKASQLGIGRQRTLGIREWVTSTKRSRAELDSMLARIASVVERGGY